MIEIVGFEMTKQISPEGRATRLTDAMRQFCGGVAVITAGVTPDRTGYTGTAVFSLSVNPERIVFCNVSGCRVRSSRCRHLYGVILT